MSDLSGDFVLVLHTHMPYLKRAGNWPVGEEWLFQAWGEAYLPVIDVLADQARRGLKRRLTLGLTPLVTHQMADPGLLERFHSWIGNALLRCEMLAANAHQFPDAQARKQAASFWWKHYKATLDSFEGKGRQLLPALRELIEDETIEVLGGPLTHAYLPLHDADTVRAQLRLGLDEGERLLGDRPRGVWLPECAYRPGLEDLLADCSVDYVVLDGPSLLRATNDFAALRRAWRLGETDVVALGRDLEVTYRVWSPTGGYPGAGAYREYHRWESETGLKLWRVTGKSTPLDEKELYDPELVDATLDKQVDDFVALLGQSIIRDGDVVVACYDTELFGHWWLEGPQWLRRLFDALDADPRLTPTTIGAHVDTHDYGDGVLEPPAGSWGLRKDFSIWENPDTEDMWVRLDELRGRLGKILDLHGDLADSPDSGEELLERLLCQGAREVALAQCSDWPFMIGHDKSAEYARERFGAHAHDAMRCFDAYEAVSAGEPVDVDGWLDGLEHDHDVYPGLCAASLLGAYGRATAQSHRP